MIFRHGANGPATEGARMSEAANWVRVAGVKQVAKGEMFAAVAGKRKIAVFHLDDGSWHATENVCTHAFAMLTDGWLEGDAIECPLHAGRFDVRTGKGLCAPIEDDLATYPVRIDGSDVMVAVPA
jgi:nitrite reductase/ring-hydroxylating ferredoxin subunit